jgi:hypothetical protein
MGVSENGLFNSTLLKQFFSVADIFMLNWQKSNQIGDISQFFIYKLR